MASPSGSPEDPGKLRGRDGRPRREEDDAPPEQKRLRLGLEGGSAETEDGQDAPRPGGEESCAPAGGEGGGVSARGRGRAGGRHGPVGGHGAPAAGGVKLGSNS